MKIVEIRIDNFPPQLICWQITAKVLTGVVQVINLFCSEIVQVDFISMLLWKEERPTN